MIAEFVATRRGASDALLPRAVAHLSLTVSVTAYEQWLTDTAQDRPGLIDEAMGLL